MKKLFNWYEVTQEESFYELMVGKLVHETPKTMTLEFNLNEKLGGLQRVQFYKHQIKYHGEF